MSGHACPTCGNDGFTSRAGARRHDKVQHRPERIARNRIRDELLDQGYSPAFAERRAREWST